MFQSHAASGRTEPDNWRTIQAQVISRRTEQRDKALQDSKAKAELEERRLQRLAERHLVRHHIENDQKLSQADWRHKGAFRLGMTAASMGLLCWVYKERNQ